MKKLSSNEKILIIVLSIFILGFIYQKYFLSPVLSEIQSVNQKIVTSTDKVSNIKIAQAQNKKQAIELKDIQLKFQQDIITLPQNERNPEIPYSIKKISDDSNKVIINNITLGKGTEYVVAGNSKTPSASSSPVEKKTTTLNDKLMACPVTLNVSSDYISLISFIAALEKDKRIAEIDSVTISEGDKVSNILTASIILNYYYIGSAKEDSIKYEFNNGIYGKDNLFK